MIKKYVSEKHQSSPFGAHLFWPEKRWRELQYRSLVRHIRHAGKSEFYRGRLPGALKSLRALGDWPLTDKDQLAAAGDAAYACSPEAVREWVTTSGTTGKPLRVPLTGLDLERLAENEAVALNIAGLGRGDTLILALDRMFVAGLAYWLGAQRLGAACIRAGSAYGSQFDVLASLLYKGRRSFVITVPSLLPAAGGLSSADDAMPGLRAVIGIGIGEPLRTAAQAPNTLARRLTDKLHVLVLSTYACTETCSTFAEGPKCMGGHLNPALAVVEIIDANGEAVPAGTAGEVVVTPLGVQGMPLVRFCTGDIAALYTEPCPCGRTTPRLGAVVGRKRQLLKVCGSSLFPSAIFDCLNGISEIRDYAVIVHQSHDLSDRLELHVCLYRKGPEVRERIAQRARALLKVQPPIIVTDLAAIRRLQCSSNPRKPSRFIDRRDTRPGQ